MFVLSEKIKIAVFTSIRSEYGLLSPLIELIESEPNFELELLVGGAHLLSQYGETINQIRTDGHSIKAIFDFIDDQKLKEFSTNSISKLQQLIGKYFSVNKPDLLIVLGDRYELIPVAMSALLYHIPMAHISGGETTEGAIDNQIRHALTKLSHLHFPATQIYKENIIKMGEEDWRICVSGEPGLDGILSIDYISKADLYEDLGLDISKKTICCTFHPQTIDNKIDADYVRNLLESIVSTFDLQILTTASNFDDGGNKINEMLVKLSSINSRIKYVSSLGQRRYYSFLKYADLMLGNSSSGLVEAQSFNLPVVNVGDRQKGRLANLNVINTSLQYDSIIDSIRFAFSEEFKVQYFNKQNIYGDGKASRRIVDFIKKNISSPNIFIKKDIF